MDRGCEWIVDAEGCEPARLRDAERLARLCGQVIEALGLKVAASPQWHRFPAPGGITGLILLAESHLACHTFPETGWASFNLYCCREVADWPWKAALGRELGATSVRIRKVARGPGVSMPRTERPR